MPIVRRPTLNGKSLLFSILSESLGILKFFSFNCILISTAIFIFIWMYFGCSSPDVDMEKPSFSLNNFNPFNRAEPDTETTTESTTAETPTTSLGVLLNMDDRKPEYVITTLDGQKPTVDPVRNKLLDFLNLPESCKDDSSNTVIDVAAQLGDLGLYAGICGCKVFIFESDPTLSSLIQSSITANEFPETRVRLYNKSVGIVQTKAKAEAEKSNDASAKLNDDPNNAMKLDELTLASSVFLLHINRYPFELETLRSAETFFLEKRIRYLVFYLDTVEKDQSQKQEVIDYLRKKLRARRVFLFRPSETNVYGPLNVRHLNELASKRDEKRRFIGILATFDLKVKVNSLNAAQYDANSFFS